MIRLVRTRSRRAALAVLAVVLAVVGTTPGVAQADNPPIVYGPWSCGPDQNAGIAFWVTGTSGYLGIDMYSSYTTIWGDDRATFSGAQLNAPSTRTVWAPYWGRTIYWFDPITTGNARLNSYYKDCR